MVNKDFTDDWFNKNNGLSLQKDQLAELLKIATTNQLFRFNGQLYEQTDGVAMGSPHGLLIANVFMCHLEEILTRDDLIPHLYKRYVDDTLARMPSTAAAVVFPITLYSLHSSLTYTMELLTVDKISFYFLLNLRLKFTKNQQTLIFSLPINPIETFFKDNDTPSAHALSSTTEAFNEECVKLRSILSRLDYLKGPIDSAINNFILQMLRQAQQKETPMIVGQ